jgi:hypothetical protein
MSIVALAKSRVHSGSVWNRQLAVGYFREIIGGANGRIEPNISADHFGRSTRPPFASGRSPSVEPAVGNIGI